MNRYILGDDCKLIFKGVTLDHFIEFHLGRINNH